MDIKVIHDTILYYLNKEQNGYVTHEEIDQVLDKAQLALFNQYHTNPRLPSQVQASLYGESQRIDDALSLFKARHTFTGGGSPVNITSGGVVTMPSNYMHLISMYTTVFNATLSRNVYSGVQVLNEEELIERLESQVIPVSVDDPIAIMNASNQIQLFPEQAQSGGVYYFRRPVAPRFGYSQSGRTVTYNPLAYDPSTQPTGSTQLEWRDYDVNNIISIALSYYGLNLSSQEVMQFAQVKTQEGQ
jgi:hypothetical protein